MSSLAVLVLAAGDGTRMKSARPKVLHEIACRPMLGHVLAAVVALQPERMLVVIGKDMEAVAAAAAPAEESRGGRAAYILYAQQSRRPLGFRIPQPARTGRGVRCAGALVVPHRSLS